MKKIIITKIFFLIILTILATISANAISYNIYSQQDNRNFNMTVSGIDYANQSVGAYNNLYYGCSPKGTAPYYIKEFMVTTSLGTPILNNINTLNLATVTAQCSAHGPCYCEDLGVDPHTGNIYFSVTPNFGNYNAEFLTARPDLSNVVKINISGVSFGTGTNGGFTSAIDVNSQKTIPVIITYGISNKIYLFNSVVTNNYNQIINISLNATIDPAIFSPYITTLNKMSFNPLYPAYYSLINSQSERLANTTTTYLLINNDLTISGLRAPTMDDVTNISMNNIYFDYGISGFAQTFKKTNGVYKLFNVALTNFSALPTSCTGTNYSLLSCYYDGVRCNCYDNSAVCLPNNELYTGVNDSNYLCQNAITDPQGGLYCGNALSYCAGGCVNIGETNNYGVNYTHGVCTVNSSTCNSECIVEGDVYSDTPTSYRQCGFYNNDVCLHWSNSIVCSSGQISINGLCTNVNRVGTLTTLRNFQVTPNLTYSTSYSDATTPPIATYNFPTVFYSLGFGVSASPTSYYIARNCNYTETNIYSNLTTANNINTTVSNSFLNFQGGYTKISLLPNQNTTTEVKGLDASGNIFFDYYVAVNDTLGACLLNRTDGTIGCYYQPYSNIQGLVLTVDTFTQNGNTISSPKLDINLVSGGANHLYVTWDNQISPVVTTYSTVTTTGTNYSVSSVQVFNAETESPANGFISWFNTSWNVYSQGKCLFTTLGCRTVRTYYTEVQDGILWNYKDWNICVNSLGNNVLGSGGGSNELTPTVKLFIGILGPIGLFLIFLVFGLLAFDGRFKVILMFIGIFAMAGALIFFALAGWLPPWIIVLMVLFASATIIFIVRSVVVGRDEG